MDGADRVALLISWRLGLAGGIGASWMLILVVGMKTLSLSESTRLGPAVFLLHLIGPTLTSLLFLHLLPTHLRGRWIAVTGLAGLLGYVATSALTVVVPATLKLFQGATLSFGATAVVSMLILLSVSPALVALGAFVATDPD